jgi:molybdopterin-containing oxidoreductase family membrane subunit
MNTNDRDSYTLLKKIGTWILILTTIAGAGTILNMLIQGHGSLNTTQHVPWGLWVALYIYFLGLSAGSFLLSTLIYVFGFKRFEPIGPLALLQALVCLLLGGFLIFIDLGHPFRIYKVLFSLNPTSVMAWMGVFYNVYIVIVCVELYIVLKPALVSQMHTFPAWVQSRLVFLKNKIANPVKDAALLKKLGIMGIPVAIIVHGGVGSIFAVAKARPNWFSGLFPIIFLISALASGGALLTFLTSLFYKDSAEKKMTLVRNLARLTIGILGFDLLLLFSEIFVTYYGGIQGEVMGWNLTLFGPYWGVFWFVQILLGAVVPILIVMNARLGSSVPWLGLSGFLVVFGILGTRLNIVIPPLIRPTFDALPTAYFHARNALGYFPSHLEWMVAVFTFAIFILVIKFSLKFLPMGLEKGEEK